MPDCNPYPYPDILLSFPAFFLLDEHMGKMRVGQVKPPHFQSASRIDSGCGPDRRRPERKQIESKAGVSERLPALNQLIPGLEASSPGRMRVAFTPGSAWLFVVQSFASTAMSRVFDLQFRTQVCQARAVSSVSFIKRSATAR